MPPWLHPTLCIAGLAAGVALHLAWHPLRRHFSDAYQFMAASPRPLAAAIAVLLLHGAPEARLGLAHGTFAAWQDAVAPVLRVAAVDAAVLLHQAVPPLPQALLLPLWLWMLTVRLMRHPYRFQKERLRVDQQTLLVALSSLAAVWAAVFLTTPRGAGEATFLGPVMEPLTLFFSAMAAAVCQVWLARLVIQWAEPADQARTSAGGECMARWRSILWLGSFSALWSGYRDWIGPGAAWVPWSIMVEVLLVFAPLPVAVAARRGTPAQAGGLALRMILRGGAPLLAWGITAMVLLALGRHAVETSAVLGAAAATLVHGLVTGVLSMWLLPAAMLLLYRRGFPSQDQPPP